MSLNIIHLIKDVRQQTGLNLLESKQIVDRFLDEVKPLATDFMKTHSVAYLQLMRDVLLSVDIDNPRGYWAAMNALHEEFMKPNWRYKGA